MRDHAKGGNSLTKTAKGSDEPDRARRVADEISLTGTTILYCRNGMISNAEVNQQSSVQSAKATGHIQDLGKSTCLLLGQQLYEWLLKHSSEDFARRFATDLQEEEQISIWFYNVVDVIGINQERRTSCQQKHILLEIICTFTGKNPMYYIGSSIEGTFVSGDKHDEDVVKCPEDYIVFEKIKGPVLDRKSYLIIRETDIPAGYFKLQLLVYGTPCTSLNISEMSVEENFINRYCKTDKCERKVLHELVHLPDGYILYTKRNRPAMKTKDFGISLDNNISCRCKQWPTFAEEWIYRKRLFGWPTKSMVQQLSLLGFFTVKKGHPLSTEKDLLWTASFSLQERELMFILTDVQHKCYTVLKILNREIIESKCITSYHWKTCLFYLIEQTLGTFWKKEHLWGCIKLCIVLMLRWVESEFCPNYFIPEDNLFGGTLTKSKKLPLERKLRNLLKDGPDCLLSVKTGKICDYYRTQDSLEEPQKLLSHSKHELNKELYSNRISRISVALDCFNKKILDRYYRDADGDVFVFIQNLWSIQQRIIDTKIVTEHTAEETKNALSSLLPHIYTCLAGNIAAIAIQNVNLQVQCFLLFGSFDLFRKGSLPGKLKLISVLYAIRWYKAVERNLYQLDEDFSQNVPSFCCCILNPNDKLILTEDNFTTEFNTSTCVSFLPSELPITPDALKFEMFRYFGTFATEKERAHTFFQWHYRAVVDCNVYFFYLKYLIQIKRGILNMTHAPTYLGNSIKYLLEGQHVRHRDVAYNLIAWPFVTFNFYPPKALLYLKYSLDIMNSFDLSCFMIKKEIKPRQYQFNAANLHALVVVYNTWFARKSPNPYFCFHCFDPIRKDPKRHVCRKCQVSTYCSKQCKTNDCKIHSSACIIVNRYHNTYSLNRN